MRRVVRFEVAGRPATFATKHEVAWRSAVAAALDKALSEPTVVPPTPGSRFMLRIQFRTPVPVNVSDAWDLDNLIKPTMDALGGVLGYRQWNGPQQADDETVDQLEASKRTAGQGDEIGATIEVLVINH